MGGGTTSSIPISPVDGYHAWDITDTNISSRQLWDTTSPIPISKVDSYGALLHQHQYQYIAMRHYSINNNTSRRQLWGTIYFINTNINSKMSTDSYGALLYRHQYQKQIAIIGHFFTHTYISSRQLLGTTSSSIPISAADSYKVLRSTTSSLPIEQIAMGHYFIIPISEEIPMRHYFINANISSRQLQGTTSSTPISAADSYVSLLHQHQYQQQIAMGHYFSNV